MVNSSRTLAVLALAAAIAAGAVGSATRDAGAAAAAGDCTPGADWGTQRDDLAAQTIQLVNAHRASLGLRQLVVVPALQASAVWKARHMAKYSYMAHDDPAPPVARSAGERMAACGYTSSWGENIAYGYPTAASVVSGWLGSPGHKANIENPNFAGIGSGAAVGAGQVYWAHTFGTSTAGVPPAPAPPPPPPTTPPPTTPPPTTPPPTTPKPPAPAPPGTPAPAPGTPAAPVGSKTASAAPNVVTLKGLNVTPSRPKAGETLKSAVAVTKRGVRMTRGHVFCSARVNGRPLEVLLRTLRRGTAACVWRLPASAEGKTVSAAMIVQQGRLRAVAPFRITAS
jgi:uncharacterized protein YkwD